MKFNAEWHVDLDDNSGTVWLFITEDIPPGVRFYWNIPSAAGPSSNTLVGLGRRGRGSVRRLLLLNGG
jgi:hypothetical protein